MLGVMKTEIGSQPEWTTRRQSPAFGIALHFGLHAFHTHYFNAMATYDSLHRQCRTLESLFDSKLTSYSRLASTISRNESDVEASGSGERWKDLQNEIEDLLENACIITVIQMARFLIFIAAVERNQ